MPKPRTTTISISIDIKAQLQPGGYDGLLAFLEIHKDCLSDAGLLERRGMLSKLTQICAGAICFPCGVAFAVELYSDDSWDRFCRLKDRYQAMRDAGAADAAAHLSRTEAARVRGLIDAGAGQGAAFEA